MSDKNQENSKKQNPDEEFFEVEVDQEFGDNFHRKYTEDKLDIKRLLFWVLTGMSVAFLLIVVAYNMHGVNSFIFGQQIADKGNEHGIMQKRARENKILSSYGIVNLKKGIYRIPIDSAISIYVKDNQDSTINNK